MSQNPTLVEQAEALLASIKETKPCECQARDGFIEALKQVGVLLDTFPVFVEQAELYQAVIDDRKRLMERVDAYLVELGVPQPSPEGVKADLMKQLAEALTALGLKIIQP